MCISLEPRKRQQIEGLLARNADFSRVPVLAAELGGHADWITPAGDLRTLPSHNPSPPPAPGGIDGFFAARLRRAG